MYLFCALFHVIHNRKDFLKSVCVYIVYIHIYGMYSIYTLRLLNSMLNIILSFLNDLEALNCWYFWAGIHLIYVELFVLPLNDSKSMLLKFLYLVLSVYLESEAV